MSLVRNFFRKSLSKDESKKISSSRKKLNGGISSSNQDLHKSSDSTDSKASSVDINVSLCEDSVTPTSSPTAFPSLDDNLIREVRSFTEMEGPSRGRGPAMCLEEDFCKDDRSSTVRADVMSGGGGDTSSSTAVNRELSRRIAELESALAEQKSSKVELESEVVQLKFQLSVLRDHILDSEETIKRANHLEREKHRELSLFKRDFESLKYKCQSLEKAVEFRDEKLMECGYYLTGRGELESTPNGATAANMSTDSVLSEDDLVSRLQAEVNSLKLDLQIESSKNQNLDGNKVVDSASTETTLQVKMRELEFKNSKLEKDKDFIEQTLQRTEKQREREATRSKELEGIEEKLRAETKSLKKELKILQGNLEEVESNNASLKRKLDKLERNKKNSSAAL